MIIDALCFLGQGRGLTQTPEDLLGQMDRAQIDRAVVCPVLEHVTVYNREGNDTILEYVRRYPTRLIGFATVNPWYGSAAVAELERALTAGLSGVYLNSARQGYFIHDDLVHPVIRVAEAFSVPVYFHTATPIFALPFQLTELAYHFPKVNFIMGHLAAADYWTDAVPAARQVPNIYLETSMRSGIATLREAVREVGGDRVVFGSSSPESDPEIELAKIRLACFSPEEETQILGGTMARLLGLGDHLR
jgi:predicted TIM-barrel fold metal-dependent hydrolase